MADLTALERYFEALMAELNQERAAVLGRFGRRVEKALDACAAEQSAIDDGDEAALGRYRAARREAQRAIADLCLRARDDRADRPLLGAPDLSVAAGPLMSYRHGVRNPDVPFREHQVKISGGGERCVCRTLPTAEDRRSRTRQPGIIPVVRGRPA